MSDDDRALFVAVDALYRAATEAAYWSAAMRAVRDLLCCHCIVLSVQDPDDGRILLRRGAPDDDVPGACRRDRCEFEVCEVPAKVEKALAPHPYSDGVLGDEVVVRRCRDPGGRFHESVSVSFLGQYREARGLLEVHWRCSNREPSWAPMARLETLLPHLERAVCVATRLAVKREFNATARAALECLPHAVFIIGPDRRVRHRNRKAAQILVAADALRLSRGELHAIRTGDDQTMQALIRAESNPQGSARRTQQSVIKLLRRSDPAPYELRVIRLSHITEAGSEAQAYTLMVLVSLPGQPRSLAVRDVMSLHGLTRMQARIAIELCAGLDVKAAARHLGITTPTARTHLQSVFRRTGIHSQNQLIARLLASPLSYRPAEV